MNRYLIITGGSRGIGEKTIYHFLQQSWRVINISRTPCHIQDVINFQIDLSCADDVHKQIDNLHHVITEKSIISLVHNAASYKRDNVTNLSVTDLQMALQTNVVSPAALNQIWISKMQPGSSIIYIGSTLSTKGVPENASYIVSKHALVGLMKATSQDLLSQQIHTCCICPGLVDTYLLKQSMPQPIIDQIVAHVMGQRLIEPQEIAKLIFFCADNPVVNGSIIHANLGQTEN
jgi:NAD(P)-dependent dehydrogenase (short-subunit alcohol dehydrogenase family)